jgi:hypothetical protein
MRDHSNWDFSESLKQSVYIEWEVLGRAYMHRLYVLNSFVVGYQVRSGMGTSEKGQTRGVGEDVRVKFTLFTSTIQHSNAYHVPTPNPPVPSNQQPYICPYQLYIPHELSYNPIPSHLVESVLLISKVY